MLYKIQVTNGLKIFITTNYEYVSLNILSASLWMKLVAIVKQSFAFKMISSTKPLLSNSFHLS